MVDLTVVLLVFAFAFAFAFAFVLGTLTELRTSPPPRSLGAAR